MSRKITDLSHGWNVNISSCGNDHGHGVIINVFEHPTTGYAVFAETATDAAALTADRTDTLTPAAHAYAVSLGALDA